MRGTPQQITAEITLVDGLLTPVGQRTAFVRRRVLVGSRELLAGARAGPSPWLALSTYYDSFDGCCFAAVRPRARLQPPLGRDSDR